MHMGAQLRKPQELITHTTGLGKGGGKGQQGKGQGGDGRMWKASAYIVELHAGALHGHKHILAE